MTCRRASRTGSFPDGIRMAGHRQSQAPLEIRWTSGFFIVNPKAERGQIPNFNRIFAILIRKYRVAVTLLPRRGLLDRGPRWAGFILARWRIGRGIKDFVCR